VIAETAGRAQPLWIVRRASWFLAVLHLPFGLSAPLYTIMGTSGRRGDPWVVLPLALAAMALQLRHSFASARGERPDHWPWTFAALVVLCYAPLPYFSWNWGSMQVLVIASAAMLLSLRLAVVFIAGPVVGTAIWVWHEVIVVDGASVWQMLAFESYWTAGLLILGGALYGTTRLVQVMGELYATRTELAEIAIGRERVRVSRDLHDLLGQSLSAVSLKGDLAIRLLPRDTERARAEIESLTGLARDALHDVREIARDQHTVSLRREVDASAALLDATGIAAWIEVEGDDLDRGLQEVLAWAVREGTTNLLRHSDARTCSLSLTRHDGRLRLVILNDGFRPASGPAGTAAAGSGLAGLTERALAVSGTVEAAPTGDGWYRLIVELPAEVAA
jgi:two-component system sensor histidine kinase DesK